MYENATKQLTTIVCPDNIATSKYGKKCYKLLVFAKRQSRERKWREGGQRSIEQYTFEQKCRSIGITKLYT